MIILCPLAKHQAYSEPVMTGKNNGEPLSCRFFALYVRVGGCKKTIKSTLIENLLYARLYSYRGHAYGRENFDH
jgi:hypothetical protein